MLWVACGGGGGSVDAGPDAEFAPIEMDGLFLMEEPGGFFVYDPTTGLQSATLSGSAPVVSPDHLRVAYVDGSEIGIAEVAYEALGPYIRQARAIRPGHPVTAVRWSDDGERVFYDAGSVDPDTGTVFDCPEPPHPSRVGTVLAVPGDHLFVCPEGDIEVRDDDRLVALAPRELSPLTADGQFMGTSEMLSVTGLSTRSVEGSPFVATTRETHTEFALDDGRVARGPTGVNGKFIERVAVGIMVNDRVSENLDPPVGVEFASPHLAFDAGEWPSRERFSPIPLDEWMADGEGRRFASRGVLLDGSAAVIAIHSYVIGSMSSGGRSFLTEEAVDDAWVALSSDGTRGFRASDVPPTRQLVAELDIYSETTFLNLGDGNFLANNQPGTLGGYVDGEPYLAVSAGRPSPDGRWLLGQRQIPGDLISPCVALIGSATSRCLLPARNSAVTTVVGYGLPPTSEDDAPLVLGLSRTAAYDGARVIVFGAHFGDSGTLQVGDTEISSTDVTEWSPTRIEFVADARLGEGGRVIVRSNGSDSARGRAHWLTRTSRVATAFDALPAEPIPLGQGLNVVDLAGVEVEPLDDEGVFLSPALRDGERYVVFSGGASPEAYEARVTLESAGDRRLVRFAIEPRSADASRWQVLARSASTNEGFPPAFEYVAGELFDVGLGTLHLDDASGARAVVLSPISRGPGLAIVFGLPEFRRERTDGISAWTYVHGELNVRMPRLLLGWHDPMGTFGVPVHAPVSLDRINGMTGIESAGDIVLVTGSALLGTVDAPYALSTDGGASFTPMPFDVRELAQPIRIEGSDTRFVAFDDGSVLHEISLGGTVTRDATGPAPGSIPITYRGNSAQMQFATAGDELLVYFPAERTVGFVDLATAAPRAWQVVPAGREGEIASFHAAPDGNVYLVDRDGRIHRASSDDYSSFLSDPLPDLDLAVAADVQIRALGILPSGRAVASALFAAPGGSPHPLSPAGAVYLLGPEP